jgi:hypothetical protein
VLYAGHVEDHGTDEECLDRLPSIDRTSNLSMAALFNYSYTSTEYRYISSGCLGLKKAGLVFVLYAGHVEDHGTDEECLDRLPSIDRTNNLSMAALFKYSYASTEYRYISSGCLGLKKEGLQLLISHDVSVRTHLHRMYEV